jgi:hypothetical protein
MERSGRVQTREQLLNDVWDNDSEVAPRAIDRHVCCLRAKLGSLGLFLASLRQPAAARCSRVSSRLKRQRVATGRPSRRGRQMEETHG